MATNAKYVFDADVNRDGVINNTDLQIARENLGVTTKVSPVVSVNLDPASDPAANRTTTLQHGPFRRHDHAGCVGQIPRSVRRRHHDRHDRLDGRVQHHGPAGQRVEYVHGDDVRRIRAIDQRHDLAGRVLAAEDLTRGAGTLAGENDCRRFR